MKISVIVPSYNEGNNVIRLAHRLQAVLESSTYLFEVIYVDDSTDNTPELLEELRLSDSRFTYVHRTNSRGLATAVLEGFRQATGDVFIVMDADLQHPPEMIPEMMKSILQGNDMVIPSRFVPGGKDGGLSWSRKIVSWTARSIARLALKRARHVTDPTGGIFAVRRGVVDGLHFDPIGWKIMLEILVRGRVDKVAEIPYTFVARDLGDSKMSLQEQFRYLHHIAKLVIGSEEDFRFWKFCIVGGSGVLVNTTVYVSLVQASLNIVTAFVVASIVSMISNFVLNNRFTWSYSKVDSHWARFIKFSVVSVGGILLSSGLVYALYHWLLVNYLLSGWIGIIGGILWNYSLNDSWTFSRKANVEGFLDVDSLNKEQPHHSSGKFKL
ncbi:glycosyltransferase [Paenibacillus sp. LMG 31456]|uniref:Glycosyltransferase n=1 Tax=Paenibacillus foliorum TaxID=2654974 RepID=A0A972GMM2_9BACL|nr:glycosyltransferase family 2 protein [Paenibacillus foliorum]NOU93073.1 glycosyltransferase [Paenibacillus foliorum]